ncbi:MAG: hypothetical protein P3A28_02380 [Gemmatimonadota bacterium]|nr:hypothetical protein [Gemmatimonadota bacterium]
MHRSLRIAAAAVLVAAPVVAAAQRPLTLSKPESEYGEPFTAISGIRELKDGRVLVADARDKTLQLIDLRSGAATAVGREGSGPGEYGLPMRLVPLPGDSTALFDAGNQRYLTIHPDGKTGRDFRLEAATPPAGGEGGRGGRGGIVLGGLSIPRGFDARGNIYYEGMPFSLNDAGEMVSADSVAVLRFDRAARRVDTVAYRKVVKANAQVSGGRGNMNVRIGTGNPLSPADDWAVLPDGRVAVLRASDYHLDVFSAASRKTSGAPVPYEKIRVDAAVKKMIEDQRARNSRNAVRMTVDAGSGGTRRSTEIGGARPGEIPPLTDWPDVMPPFLANAAVARPNSEVWVLRTRKPGDDIPTYDVFDAAGRVIGKVALPKDHRLIGFGQGTVYIIRTDADDLQYPQRYRLAMDAKLTG